MSKDSENSLLHSRDSLISAPKGSHLFYRRSSAVGEPSRGNDGCPGACADAPFKTRDCRSRDSSADKLCIGSAFVDRKTLIAGKAFSCCELIFNDSLELSVLEILSCNEVSKSAWPLGNRYSQGCSTPSHPARVVPRIIIPVPRLCRNVSIMI